MTIERLVRELTGEVFGVGLGRRIVTISNVHDVSA
jgi:hypothetical protein